MEREEEPPFVIGCQSVRMPIGRGGERWERELKGEGERWPIAIIIRP